MVVPLENKRLCPLLVQRIFVTVEIWVGEKFKNSFILVYAGGRESEGLWACRVLVLVPVEIDNGRECSQYAFVQ